MFASMQKSTGKKKLSVEDIVRCLVNVKPEEEVRMEVLADGNTVVYAGLVRDDDCENPLTSCDGEGAVHFAGRRGNRDSIRAYQQALGLDDEYRHNTELYAVQQCAESMLRTRLRESHEVDLVRMTLEASERGITPEDMWADILKKVQGWRPGLMAFSEEDEEILVQFDWEALLDDAWHACMQDGTIGDPLAVLLDVYDHGGMVVSIAGTGHQCRWDTTRGGAVFVPDKYARKDILTRLAPVYTKGRVIDNGKPYSQRRYSVQVLKLDQFGVMTYADSEHPWFEHWHEAFSYLENLDVEVTRSMLDAQTCAAREHAAQALVSYNAWLSGDCWGVVCYTVDVKSLEVLDEDECWGYVGREWAEEALRDAVKSALNHATVQ